MTDHRAPIKVLSFGAGAIGTYIGGSIAHTGNQVVFLERPEVADGLRARGLHLQLGAEQVHLSQPIIVASLEQALAKGPFDVALFALKSYDTQGVVSTLTPYAPQLPPVLCLQNGVENETVIAQALGPGKVISGSVTSAIGRGQTGEIILERLRGVGIAADNLISDRLVTVMDAAGLKARLYPSAADMKWSKMLTNLLANATSAILDLPPSQIFAHPGLYRLEVEQLRETLRVMAAQGIHSVDLPGTPVRLLSFAVKNLPLSLSRPFLAKAVGGGRGAKMPSFHIDLASGRGKSEVDYLNGAVVRFGQQLGIPTPVNRLLTQVLLDLTNGVTPRNTYQRQPEKLLALWEKEKG